MKLPAKTTQAPCGGTIPLRASKNPVEGVFLHHCGSIASVHRPQGKRKNTVYLICDECGTDQCGGKPYQERIKSEMQPTIEALKEKIGETAPDAVYSEAQAEQSEPANQALAAPEPMQPETAPDAVYSEAEAEQSEPANQALATPEPEQPKPTQTVPDAVYRQSEPKKSDDKPKRITMAAGLGALLGAMLAMS